MRTFGDTTIAVVRTVLTSAEFVRLAEALGGDRVFVPKKPIETNALVRAIGMDAAARVIEAIGSGWLAVPLARPERALQYRAEGLKDHQIARRLCMTRSGVERLLKREQS
jgi:hypothetical protein